MRGASSLRCCLLCSRRCLRRQLARATGTICDLKAERRRGAVSLGILTRSTPQNDNCVLHTAYQPRHHATTPSVRMGVPPTFCFLDCGVSAGVSSGVLPPEVEPLDSWSERVGTDWRASQ